MYNFYPGLPQMPLANVNKGKLATNIAVFSFVAFIALDLSYNINPNFDSYTSLVSPVSHDVKQMLWSLPLKFASRSLMAQRYWRRVRCW